MVNVNDMLDPTNSETIPKFSRDKNSFPVQILRPKADSIQNLVVNVSPDALSTEIIAKVVRLVVVGGSVGVYVEFDADNTWDPTQANNGFYLPPNVPELFKFEDMRYIRASAVSGTPTLQISIME